MVIIIFFLFTSFLFSFLYVTSYKNKTLSMSSLVLFIISIYEVIIRIK